MMATHGTLRYRRLRASSEHGEALTDPPLSAVAERLADNAGILQADCEFNSRSLSELRREARVELLDAAFRYTRAYRDVELPEDWRELPIVLSGHQPQLFHVGVWFKDFALAALTRNNLAVGIHLLIDNDTVSSLAMRVPTGSVSAPRVESIPMDLIGQTVPWEDRKVSDHELFASFGKRVKRAIEPLVSEPLIERIWPWAVEALQSGANLGGCLSQARHRLEAAWGLNTLELPLSQVCDMAAFHDFAWHLLMELPSFRAIYNSALLEYRHVNRVRSKAHPVPELTEESDGWLEAPFWIWRRGQSRHRLFVQQSADSLKLSDRDQIQIDVGNVMQLAGLANQNIVVRPRALITTMFARLVLSDLFFHGIGGAKYDQLTDEIIRRFFGIQPPGFVTLTATARLPLDLPNVNDEDLRRVDWLLRELRYHPECHLNAKATSSSEVAQAIEEKRKWIATQLPHGERRRRHEGIVGANERLQPFVAGQRDELLAEKQKIAGQLRNRNLLASREFSFSLFPEETLRPLLLGITGPQN